MLIFTIDKGDIKLFMNKLLKDNMFDKLLLKNISISSMVKYDITGNIDKQYLREDEDREYAKWIEIKPYVLKLIAGDKKPSSIKAVFCIDNTLIDSLFSNLSAAFLNIIYENDTVLCTTGTSQKNFSLDKSDDVLWEEHIVGFFKENEIPIHIDK